MHEDQGEGGRKEIFM